MKRVVSFLLIFALVLSLAGCKRRPETSDLEYTDDRAGGDTAETDCKEPDYDDVQAVVLNPSESDGKNENKPKSQQEQPNTEAENPAPDMKPLRYTAKHEPDSQVSFSYYEKTTGYPIIYVINSKEQLEVLGPVFGVGDIFSQLVFYHERTDSVPNDYNVLIQKEKMSKLYDDSFFEKHILVFVLSKADYYSTAPEVSRVGSDGTIEIDLHIPKEQSDPSYEHFCDYIELDKEYAGLDFKVKYNEISVDEEIETRAPLPEYPNSMDFKARQFSVGLALSDYGKKYEYPLIRVISSVQELEEYIESILKPHQHKQGRFIDCLEYSRDKTADFTLSKIDGIYKYKTTRVDMLDYYTEEFFENNIICAVISQVGSGSYDFQVRSVEPDGRIVYELYMPNVVTCDIQYRCDFIELDKSCKDLSFKTEWNGLYQFYYRWNGKSK